MPRSILERAKKARDEWNGEIVKMWVMHECVFMSFTGEMMQVSQRDGKSCEVCIFSVP